MTIRIKRLIMGLALALLFVGGAFMNANAQPQFRGPAQASCQGAYHFGPATPTPFGGSTGGG